MFKFVSAGKTVINNILYGNSYGAAYSTYGLWAIIELLV